MYSKDSPIISSFIIDLHIWHGKHVVYQLGSLIRLIEAAPSMLWKSLDSLLLIHLVFMQSTTLMLNCSWNSVLGQSCPLPGKFTGFLQCSAQCLVRSSCSLNLLNRGRNEHSRALFSPPQCFPATGNQKSSRNEGARGGAKRIADEGKTCGQVSHLAPFLQLPNGAWGLSSGLGFHWNVLKVDSVRTPSGHHMVALSSQAEPQGLTAWCCFLCQHPTKCLCRCLHLTREHDNGPIHKAKKSAL